MNSLEPTGAELRALGEAVVDFVASFDDQLAERPAVYPGEIDERLLDDLRLVDDPTGLGELLPTIGRATDSGIESAGPRHFGYIPAGGLPTSALGQLIALAVNRYTAVADLTPGMVALEESVLRWLCDEFDLPRGAGGLLTAGGSGATLSAVVAARDALLGGDIASGTIYVSEHTHLCVAKSAHVAGLPPSAVRTVPVDDDLRIDPAALDRMLREDRAQGLRPFMIVGNAGTTDTGAVDPLEALSDLARREGAWFHVDGAYGGAFQLTARGCERLRGVTQADSIVLDPHKGLFMPYGVGALLVRDASVLSAAHRHDAPYLQDIDQLSGLPDYSDRGIELTRDPRGLRMWLPLRLHGVQAFRDALDEKLDLAELAYERLAADPRIDIPWRPPLSTLALRLKAGDDATRALFDEIRAEGRILLTSTSIRDRFHIRICVLAHRTHEAHVTEAVERILAG